MAKGREIKGRIHTVENTRKITRTMEMVATSKLKRAQDRVVAARPYADALQEVIASLYDPELVEQFPLLRQPSAVRRAGVLLLTSNRGLAGAFNANLLREARTLIARLEKDGAEVELHVVGRKGIGFFRYVGRTLAAAHTDIGDRPTVDDATRLVSGMMDAFAKGELDAVYVVHARYLSALSAPPTSERILPVEPPKAQETANAGREQHHWRRLYILMPDAATILGELLPAYVRNAAYRSLVENVAAEQSARRTAMKNATDNATDVLAVLRRTYNRARQAQITQEIAEIVGGAAALQG
jgi:F-type H+-transporting ATPase subunit gamma